MELKNQLKKLKQLKNKAMKKVIIEQNEKVIGLKNITDDMLVGIMWEDGTKNFLIKDDSNNTKSIGFINLKTYYCWHTATHETYVKRALRQKKSSAFVFDSPKELAQWLAE